MSSEMSKWTAVGNNRGLSYYIDQVHTKNTWGNKNIIQIAHPLMQNWPHVEIYLSQEWSVIRSLNICKQSETFTARSQPCNHLQQ